MEQSIKSTLIAELAAAAVILAVIKFGSRVPAVKAAFANYTGILSMYFGCTLFIGEWLAIVGLAQGCFAYIRKLRLEEVNMRTAFRTEYETYRRESRALVPFLY